MASGQKKKAKGLAKRVGRRAAKYARYYAGTAATRKLRHLIARNGIAAARAWAAAHNADGILARLVKD